MRIANDFLHCSLFREQELFIYLGSWSVYEEI
jgi:hypothetical protein